MPIIKRRTIIRLSHKTACNGKPAIIVKKQKSDKHGYKLSATPNIR
ncbi:beta-hexosaminidase [Neisseria gonorrhoeae]|uniref:Beta-hexosaminidase n=5 Tax=Neisseria TaxID=482 RepID=A0A0H4IVN5_NEIG1|nr:hypothetical protein [Neisseria meningitidis]ACF31214.1 beta-hexosaminidase precursor [Neisseria gonorrhoeae NCCP11945]AKO63820.1 beta-hexosaminidase [Neisseria gonorrhoeae FA 1090]ARB99620.1 beta-hexosaminidase [Neisseria gonorrhoeae]CCA45580.1 beta-hexosaminidase precursor [Neisseria meningitidis alpha522]AHW74861.1 beta-hexosaminidase [Neisseria meningitidis]